MEFTALNDDCLFAIFNFLNKEDLVSLSKIVYHVPLWNHDETKVEKVRCYRLKNVCGLIVKRKFCSVTLKPGSANENQFLRAFPENIKELKINFRFDEVEEMLKAMKGVTSRNVTNLAIVNLANINSQSCECVSIETFCVVVTREISKCCIVATRVPSEKSSLL